MVEKNTKPAQKPSSAKATGIKASVFSFDGKSNGTVSLNKEIFGVKPNKALVAQYIRVYLNNQRQGNASAKTRAEIVGTTKKIWRQKGTGRARHGAPKANLFRGGGVTFGPKPKDFSMSMNKKQKKMALFCALSAKAKDETIKVLEVGNALKKPNTKKIAQLIGVMDITGKVVFVLSKVENNAFVKSARNIRGVEIIQATTLNAYEVLNHKNMIFVDEALDSLEKHYLKK